VRKQSQGLACFAFALAALCCASSCYGPRYNKELKPTDIPMPEFDPALPVAGQDDETLFLACFSGGGTRAAALSWEVLEELRKIPYHYKSADGTLVQSTLADEIDCVSGISGGSFSAAAWCLFRNDPQAMQAFRKDFIERDIQMALLKNLLLPPWRMLSLISPSYDRINASAELYDREVYSKKTFRDLPEHPTLWINATNLSLGNRFTFTPTDFSFLNSDLSTYPIGLACAASSAFPILLSPLTLINYGKQVDLGNEQTGEDAYINAQLNARDNLDVESALYVRMRDFYNDKRNKYIHLADGGLVDNQGLQAILDQYSTDGIIFRRLNFEDRPLKRLIVLNVNAGVAGKDRASRKKSAPGVTAVLSYSTVLSMDLLSGKRWTELSRSQELIGKALESLQDSSLALSKLEQPYAIEINFRNLRDVRERAAAMELPTSFALDSKQLGMIDKATVELVEAHPELARLKRSLNESCKEAGCTHAPIPVSPLPEE
jgi:predicted acylesterase/phospholipase RssA